MRRNTPLKEDFSRHSASLLHILPHWKEPCCIFGCKHRTAFTPAVVLWSPGDPSLAPRRTRVPAQYILGLKPPGLHLGSIPREHLETATRVVSGRAEAGTSYIQDWNEIKDPLPQNYHASKSSSMIQQRALHLRQPYVTGRKQPALVNHSFQFTAVWLLTITKVHYTHISCGHIDQFSITALKNSGYKTVKQIHRVKS